MLLAPSLSPGQGSDRAPAGPHAAGEPRSVLGPSPCAVVSPKAQPSARMVVVGFDFLRKLRNDVQSCRGWVCD